MALPDRPKSRGGAKSVNTNLSIDYEWREWVIEESVDDDETDIQGSRRGACAAFQS